MKAGVYILFDSGLVYVRKDRTVSAVAGTDYPVQIGVKVQTFEGGKTILIPGDKAQLHGTRTADVPNGCTDHQALVDSMHMAANLEPGQRVVDYGTKFARVEEIDEPGVTSEEQAGKIAHADLLRAMSHEEAGRAIHNHIEQQVTGDPYKNAAARFYSGGVVPQAGDILIEFEDNGQDFLRWTLRDDAEGYTRVIDSQPYQRDVWAGMIVHNADNLVSGRTDVAYVGRDPEDSRNLLHRVTSAKRVEIGKLQMLALDTERRFVGVPPALAAPYGETDLVEWRKKFAASLREQGFRICHARSARSTPETTVVSPEDNSRQARQGLRNMPQTRDAILNLLLIEAGVHFADGALVKTANVSANVGVRPETALARVIAKHLRLEYTP